MSYKKAMLKLQEIINKNLLEENQISEEKYFEVSRIIQRKLGKNALSSS